MNHPRKQRGVKGWRKETTIIGTCIQAKRQRALSQSNVEYGNGSVPGLKNFNCAHICPQWVVICRCSGIPDENLILSRVGGESQLCDPAPTCLCKVAKLSAIRGNELI